MIIMIKWRCDGFYDSFCDSFLIKGFQPCFLFCHYFISRLYIAIYGYHYLQYIARYSYSYSHRNFAFQSLVRTLVDTCWYYLVLMGVLFIQRWIPFFVCCPGNGLLTVCCVINGTRLSVVMGWILFSEEETPSLYSVFTTKQKAITERERERESQDKQMQTDGTKFRSNYTLNVQLWQCSFTSNTWNTWITCSYRHNVPRSTLSVQKCPL